MMGTGGFLARFWEVLTLDVKMWIRGITALSLLAALGQDATAGEKPDLVHRASCSVVRYYVATFSEATAEAYARSKGATDAEIEAARSCLKPSDVRTANNQR
jgi:hypothetical protein